MSNITLRWSIYEIVKDEADYLMEEHGLDEDEAFEQAGADDDLIRDEWESLCEALTDLMKRINPHGRRWIAEVQNFGWRSQDGHAVFDVQTGEELLQKALPETDCTFTIYFDFRRRLISIDNAHHDKPMGGEWYYFRPATLREEQKIDRW